jgi:hypothetical protein
MMLNKNFTKIVLSAFLCLNAISCSAAEGEIDFPKFPASKNVPQLKVETVVENVEIVWSIVFAPDGRMFFT